VQPTGLRHVAAMCTLHAHKPQQCTQVVGGTTEGVLTSQDVLVYRIGASTSIGTLQIGRL
jgi:hypothetical protein